MDIRKWLEDTSLPDKPSLPEQLGLPSFLRPKKDGAEHAEGRHHHRKRKLPSTNSSFIEAEAPAATVVQNDHRLKRKRKEEDEVTIDESCLSDSSEDTQRSPSAPYERRPRAKPRPDLYEPKDEKDKRHKKHKRRKHESEEEPKREKRKSRRKKEKSSAGLIHSFHAKNVPKDRLTLKPGASLGLFKKGRASSPVRGRGLPDLVFSEMSFLKKRKDNIGEQENEQPKKSRKRDRARVNEEEISAYFKAKRPALAEKDINIISKPHPSHRRSSVPSEQSRKRQQSMTVESAILTVELPGKPYLGFGSRGNRPPSTACLSWSESVRQASNTPAFRGPVATIDVGQLRGAQASKSIKRGLVSPPPKSAVHSGETSPTWHDKINHGRALSTQPNSGDTEGIQASHERQTRRIEEQHLLDTLSVHRREIPSSHKDRGGVTNNKQQNPNIQGGSNRRSSVTDPARPVPQPGQDLGTQQDSADSSNKENTAPRTSSPLGKLLKDCDAAFAENGKWDIGQSAWRRDQDAQTCPQILEAQPINRLTEQVTIQDPESGVFDDEFPLLTFSQPRPELDVLDRNLEPLTAQVEYGDVMQPLGEGDYSDVHGGGAALLDDGFEEYGAGAFREELNEIAEEMGQQEGEQGGEDDVFAGFWRPHKLY